VAAVRGETHARRQGGAFALEREAHGLADRLPDLILDALRVSNTIAHGIHGRRRPGSGETFWQFRHFQTSDAAALIDWRRSASSDHLYVREREWEAAHTVWLWPDLSASMNFCSHLAAVTKRDRALVLMLALGELLVRGGERIGLLGVTAPTASRKATTRIAEALITEAGSPALTDSLPPRARLSRFSAAILVSDFLEPIEQTSERLKLLAADGVAGHLVAVYDPAEETLPYDGRAEFLGLEGSERWLVDRVETLREQYRTRFQAHRAALLDVAHRLGWTFLVHHTDRPAAEPLLALMAQLQGLAGDYRWRPAGQQGARIREPVS
jgi:uncharacterized protein (DUF58 family)